MTQDKLEIIRGFYDAWNRRAWDEALRDAAPDIEFDLTSNSGEWRGVHVGPDQVKRMFERFVDTPGCKRSTESIRGSGR